MHELSVAVSLVELACDEAARLGNVRVNAVHVRMGPLCGVVKDALLFSFDVAAADTPVAGASLTIEDVPLSAWCPCCAAEVGLHGVNRRCPICATPTPTLIHGREMELVALEVSDDDSYR